MSHTFWKENYDQSCLGRKYPPTSQGVSTRQMSRQLQLGPI